jgi:hypothetical protein
VRSCPECRSGNLRARADRGDIPLHEAAVGGDASVADEHEAERGTTRAHRVMDVAIELARLVRDNPQQTTRVPGGRARLDDDR